MPQGRTWSLRPVMPTQFQLVLHAADTAGETVHTLERFKSASKGALRGNSRNSDRKIDVLNGATYNKKGFKRMLGVSSILCE